MKKAVLKNFAIFTGKFRPATLKHDAQKGFKWILTEGFKFQIKSDVILTLKQLKSRDSKADYFYDQYLETEGVKLEHQALMG